MKVRSTLRDLTVAAAAICVTSVLLVSYIAPQANADHEPAMKAAVMGSDVDKLEEGENVATLLLSDRMRVSSPEDIILQTTAECTILTELITGGTTEQGATDTSTAYGSVRLWVTLDGTRVPVATDDLAEDGTGEQDNSTGDVGEVTFCNRTYSRTVTDDESPQDGLDEEHDYIRTRTANAFNWVALDTGVLYDSPTNGNNIIDVQLWAEYDTTEAGRAVADAFVGSRTLIAEPIRVTVHEQVAPVPDASVSPAPGNGNGNGKP